MARQRRITELIEDEVKKPATSKPADGVIDVTATTVDKTDSKSVKPSGAKIGSKAKNEDTVAETTQTQESPPEKTVVVKEVVKEIIDPNPELEAKIAKLQAELDRAAQNAIAQQEELAIVKQQLSEEQSVNANLSKELQSAKQSAIHLAESNEQLNQEINQLKQEKEAIVAQIEAEKSKHKGKMEPFKQQPQPQSQSSHIQKSHKPVYQPVPVRKTDRIYRDRFFARVPPTPASNQDEDDNNSSSQMWLLD